jgi:hypothetical protein
MKNSLKLSLAFVTLSACANNNTTATSTEAPTTTQSASGGEHAGHPEHHFTPAQHAFHEVLSPIWHSDPSPARDTRACEQAAALRERANPINAEAAPANAPANFTTSRAELVRATEALITECAGPRAAIADRLRDVHTAFHSVFEGR